jgi:hypothetical protein
MKRADELGAEITEDGDVVEGAWTVAAPAMPEAPEKEPETPKYTTIEALMVQWTPEAIMAANDGRIPATSEECQQVALKLIEKLEAASG